MKSYYSLIKLIPNESSEESLTIGILVFSNQRFLLQFSNRKKRIAQSLFSFDSKLLTFIEREIEEKIKQQNQLSENSKEELFSSPDLLNENYFHYLNKYSNGLLRFSSPRIIADTFNEKKFHQLFTLLVDDVSDKNEKPDPNKIIEKKFYSRIEKNLLKKVQGKIHTHQRLDNKVVPSLISPFEMDCIGKNGVYVGAKSLPFNRTQDTLNRTINTYISIIAHLNKNQKKNHGNHFFLIADQPDKKSKGYKYWKQLYDANGFYKMIDSNDSEIVAETVNKNNASTFIE